ncbi:MAG: hypothetical protein KF774_20960 [Planctomyces sp.]|nr:hypothetical protein [Planctomyces sp.]
MPNIPDDSRSVEEHATAGQVAFEASAQAGANDAMAATSRHNGPTDAGFETVGVERKKELVRVSLKEREGSRVSPMDGWLETIWLEGKVEPVRVTLEERVGSRVLLRQVDPEEPELPKVQIYKGDELLVMQAVSHLSEHTGLDPKGSTASRNTGFLFSYRVVPVRREPGIVYARILRRGEADTGQRIHVRPGERITFERGSVVAELGHIDAMEPPTASGYVPLSPVLWTWLALGAKGPAPARTLYILAAARRLDTANLLLATIEQHREDLKQNALTSPALRRAMFELIGAVELAVVALARALTMVRGAAEAIGASTPVPQMIVESAPAIRAIRDAYEHIEERALGKVRNKQDPATLTIFEYNELIDQDRITYGIHQLDLATEVPELLHQARAFLIETAGDESIAPR